MTAIRPSKIELVDGVLHITSAQGVIGFADAADLPLVEGIAWQAIGSGSLTYLQRRYKDGKTVRAQSLHRRLMNAPVGVFVDHVDGHGLNNRRSNLRLCTRAENAANTTTVSATGFRGVYRVDSRYEARASIGGKRVHLGRFDTPEEASEAYQKAQPVRPEFRAPRPSNPPFLS